MKNWRTYKLKIQTRTGDVDKLFSAVSNVDAIRRSKIKIVFMRRHGECLGYAISSMKTGKVIDEHYYQSYYDHVMDSL